MDAGHNNGAEATMKRAHISINGATSGHLVIFGFERPTGFEVSYAQPSRVYKTVKGAERAAAKWEATDAPA